MMLRRARKLWTLWLGLALIIACNALVAVDVSNRGGLLVPYDAWRADLPEPDGALGHLARWAAMNVTPLCWIGALLALDGLLTWLAHRRRDAKLSPLRARPNRFVVIWLASIPVWCVFDGVNFYLMDAWAYHGLPPWLIQRIIGYFIAFAAILPGMFMTAQLVQSLGVRRLSLRTSGDESPAARRITWALVTAPAGLIVVSVMFLLMRGDGPMSEPMGLLATLVLLAAPGAAMAYRTRCPRATSFAIGAGFITWTLLAGEPIANMTLWVGVWLLLDPINAAHGAPSLLADWLQGRYGRTASLFVGGAVCGLLWEWWNYWAIAKWTYDLPFLDALGAWQQISYFEMPLPGFAGFLPFAAQCWVMISTILLVLRRLNLRVAEPLPDEWSVM